LEDGCKEPLKDFYLSISESATDIHEESYSTLSEIQKLRNQKHDLVFDVTLP
jgi:hypothetical protein